MKPNPDVIRKILVVTLSNLGDVILTLPVFQTLIENFPAAKIHVMVSPSAAEVFQDDTRITRIIRYDKKMSWRQKWNLLQTVRKERYSLIVDLRHSLIGLWGGAPFRNAYFSFANRTMHQSKKHWLSLKDVVSCDFPSVSFLRLKTDSDADSSMKFDDHSRLVVAAVGSKSDVKKWPAEYYAELLDRLSMNEGCRIVLAGDQNDCRDAAEVKSRMRSPVIDLCGRTNFQEFCNLLASASLLITNDSAPLHIADALKTPILALFGPTDPRKYGPTATGSLAVRRVLFCSPCEKAQCRYAHECMKELTVDEIYQKSLQILNDEFQPKNLKILVIRLDRIGDVILSLPAVEAIRRRFPNASISLMVRPYTQGIVSSHQAVDEVIPYYYEKGGRHSSILGNIRFLREISKRHFDIAFILHPSHRSYNVPFFSGIPYRIGFKTAFPFFLTHGVIDRRHEGLKHESEYTLDIVRAFGINETTGPMPRIPVLNHEMLNISRILNKNGVRDGESIIVFHPGASCASKKWPIERFALLGKKLMVETAHRLVVIGGSEEAALGEYLKREWGNRGINLTGLLDLKSLAALFKRSTILVSNDSGPIHLAAAVGTGTFGIFGRNEAGLSAMRWRALGEGHRIIQKDVGCVVCLAHRCTIGFECLKAVEVGEVFLKVKEMLQCATKIPDGSVRAGDRKNQTD